MRKILLATTALIAVAGVSAANAEVTLSGGYNFTYVSGSDDQTDNSSKGENATSMGSDIDLAASYSTTTDSGLAISVSYDIDGDTGDVSIAGDFGTLTFDDGNEAMGIGGGDANSVEDMNEVGGNTILYNGDETINGGMIAYSSTIGGIAFGVGFGDGGHWLRVVASVFRRRIRRKGGEAVAIAECWVVRSRFQNPEYAREVILL